MEPEKVEKAESEHATGLPPAEHERRLEAVAWAMIEEGEGEPLEQAAEALFAAARLTVNPLRSARLRLLARTVAAVAAEGRRAA